MYARKNSGIINNELKYLEILTGEKWTGLRLSYQSCVAANHKVRLCEAIAQSFEQNFTLSSDDISCPGALRSLGNIDNDEQLSRHISKEAGLELNRVLQIIRKSPRMDKPVKSIELGRFNNPEIYISYPRPESAMKLLRQWQQTYGQNLDNTLSGFMAICSAVAGVYNSHKIAFSLGCPESRRYGSISSDRMVAILPHSIIINIIKEDVQCQHMNIDVTTADTTLKNSRT